jgi:hypothetical protein
MTVRLQLPGDFRVAVEAVGLVKRALVGAQPQPLHAVEDDLDGFLGGAGAVRVLDAEHEGAAVAPGQQPGEQRGAHPADVQEAGGAGGEAGADGAGLGDGWEEFDTRAGSKPISAEF